MNLKIPFIGKRVNVSMEDDALFGANGDVKKMIRESVEQLKEYKEGKTNLEKKLIENEQWYKSRHWEFIRNDKYKDDPEPVTAYLFNTLANKHADAMDAYPGANILPREQDDVQQAEILSKIIPLELEYNDFIDVWDQHWWEKLKHGCGIFGVFYDPDGGNNLGSAVIKNIDALNIYWQPGIDDIQESGSVYITKLIHQDTFKQMYPDSNMNRTSKEFEPEHYITDDAIDTKKHVLVVDRYYKKDGELHFFKFCGENVLSWTEQQEESEEMDAVEEVAQATGLYEHGEYPFVFDTLFPEKDSLHGFGYIDVLKNPQIYTDKLDQIISLNAFTTGRNRYAVSKSCNLNVDDFMDVSKTVIEVEGRLTDETFKELKQQPINPGIINFRKEKIEELKETSGANQFSRGESGGGVTAASAIAMIQQASNKLSRDMISKTYSKFSQAVYLQLEIIAQFYDIERSYRVDGVKGPGTYEFEKFSNAGLRPQKLPEVPGTEPQYRKPIFDIKIVPEKQSPFSQIAHNELAKELYALGIFQPEQAVAALTVLEMMQFEGKDLVVKKINENAQIMQQMAVFQQENEKLKAIVQELTGEDMGVNLGGSSQNTQR